MIDLLSFFTAILICIPAILMSIRKSNYLVDYMFLVIATNRCIRRIVDYHNGYFNPFSLISLTPIIVGGLATMVVLLELNNRKERFGKRTKDVLIIYGLAVSMAFVIGFLNAKFGAVYALGDFIAPIGLIGFASLYANDQSIIDRWSESFAATALLVAVYGIWQFYTIPPWDAFWLVSVKMTGYMGFPEPMKMTLFSTMNERGPAAMFLCNGLIILLLRPKTLGFLRFPALVAVGYAMLLTYSRTTVIFAALAAILYPLINRGTGIVPILFVTVVAIVFGPSLMSILPGRAAERVETVGAITDDFSFRSRIVLLDGALRNSLSEPLGLGIGNSGLASRVQAASRAGISDSTGYVETLRIYGWIGFLMIVVTLWRIWKSSRELLVLGMDDTNIRLFRAWFLSGMAALFSGNWLASASFFWVLAGYSLGRMDGVEEELAQEEEDDEDEVSEEEFLDNPNSVNA